jgi:poly(ADP-ribose) glycohydrolase ARH3
MVGDQLGAPFEGERTEAVAELWANSGRSAADWIAASRYTDDTQMMIGVAETLAECGQLDSEHLAQRFVTNYEPYRGYGAGTHRVLSALQQGLSWKEAATLAFPDGSFGNGAAMRAAPIGVFYHDDLIKLRDAAERSASITHAHPLGMEGAVLQTLALATSVHTSGTTLDPGVFLDQLRAHLRDDTGEYVQRLTRIASLLAADPPVTEVVTALGHDVRAHRSIPAAIYAFLRHPQSFEEAVQLAVRLGGDTDTIGAMTGAIAGSCHGVDGIPKTWIDALENSEKGRDYISALAIKLHERHVEERSRRT